MFKGLEESEFKRLKKLSECLGIYAFEWKEYDCIFGQFGLDVGSGYVRRLQINDTGLMRLPGQLLEFKYLEELDLNSNKIYSISGIGKLESLEKLYLDDNCLKTLPAEIGELKKLKELYANFNNLEFVCKEINQLLNLETLELMGNNLISLPELNGLQNLEKLVVSFNKLASLPELKGLKKLVFLSAMQNKIRCVPSLGPGLEILDLAFNNIQSIPDTSYIKSVHL